MFATRSRWSRDRDQAECNLQGHFAARATAAPALTSYVSRLEIAWVRSAAQMSFRGASAAHEAHVARATPRCMKHPCKQRKGARSQLWLHAVGSQSYATRLRWSCDRDLIKCSLHFYSAVEAAMPHHWQSPCARDRGDGSLQAKCPRTKAEQNCCGAVRHCCGVVRHSW